MIERPAKRTSRAVVGKVTNTREKKPDLQGMNLCMA